MHDTDPATHTSEAVWLDDPRARTAALVGAKAANLAAAHHAGLPALEGFVLPTTATAGLGGPTGPALAEALGAIRADWARLSVDGDRPLVVRSSSVGEDTGASSMAGRFTSVLRVRGWDGFVDAVAEVLASAGGVAAETGGGVALPMAVLVQPHREARLGGVLFGLDPLTGDPAHLLVSLVAGPPEDVVSGVADGTTLVLSRRGRLLRSDGPVPDGVDARLRRGLARLAATTEARFGGPQDVEWLVDPDGTLVLLQSRPVTAAAVPTPRSPLLGPGPVAETFPEPLARLERDLWMDPLEDGIREALRTSGAALGTPDRLVVAVGGRVAVDLERLGAVPVRRRAGAVLDPRPPLRRLRAAWRMGRLRRALPAIAGDLVEEVDLALRAVPTPAVLDDHELLTVLRTTRRTLAGLHAHEVLAGMLLDPGADAPTAAALALGELVRGRLDGLRPDAIVARAPVVLALVPPRIDAEGAAGRLAAMPPADPPPGHRGGAEPDPVALAREALRLRARWVHELQVRVALELGRRLVARAQLGDAASAEAVRDVPLHELVTAVADPSHVVQPEPTDEAAAPLPARFRLTAGGGVVADAEAGAGPTGVSPGRARATVTHDPAEAAGQVLVVPALAPELAPVLGSVAAVVAESGSPLSHLAILAREQSVPTVVGLDHATEVLHDGDVVVVDGATGEVRVA